MAEKKRRKIKVEDEKKEDVQDQAGTPENADQAKPESAAISNGEAESQTVGEALEDDSIPLEEKLDLVKAAWEASEEKAAEYLEGWQRAQAEFVNYKKRVTRNQEQFQRDTLGRVVKNYLTIVDDLERALKDRPQEGDGSAWAEGIELIYRKMLSLLANDGVKPMDVVGEMFDPNLHEAVAQIPSEEHESGQIVDVIQTGYLIGDRVLRPAKVAIAA